jgi:hypothetical protein
MLKLLRQQLETEEPTRCEERPMDNRNEQAELAGTTCRNATAFKVCHSAPVR